MLEVPGADIFSSRGASEYAELDSGCAYKSRQGCHKFWCQKEAWKDDGLQTMLAQRGIRLDTGTDWFLWVTEDRLGLDYLATRGDVDMDRIAHLGFSRLGLVLTAVEDRYRSIIFIGGSLHPSMLSHLPEANQVNFVPYIKPPKLLLHGRYDEVFRFETRALPLYNLMNEPKNLELVDGGHMPPLEIRVPIINSWLDETLGPVKFE